MSKVPTTHIFLPRRFSKSVGVGVFRPEEGTNCRFCVCVCFFCFFKFSTPGLPMLQLCIIWWGCPQKKSLFPVQRVAVIVANRAAAILSFFSISFCLVGNCSFWGFFYSFNFFKSVQSHLFQSLGRSTRNRLLF